MEGSDWVALLGGGTLSSIIAVIVSKYFESRKANRDREDGLDKYWVDEIKKIKKIRNLKSKLCKKEWMTRMKNLEKFIKS
ncbi:hypothetical protein [Carnobacterium inhibens]|uniref:hypothetical protein n=1 Tax=Carnobacterium inhibens TaxID=147709 RepID=UPI000550C017|nr:hypothetical protein [Carnobacterium inhibens]